jgi:hypothetical protein
VVVAKRLSTEKLKAIERSRLCAELQTIAKLRLRRLATQKGKQYLHCLEGRGFNASG